MTILRIAAAAMLFVMSSPCFAQVTHPPGSIDLTKPILGWAGCEQAVSGCRDGKPIRDDEQREAGLAVLVPFEANGVSYKLGDKVTDPMTERDIVAVLESRKAAYSVGPLDPLCDKCGPLTIGKVLSIALASKICPQDPRQPKPPQCTPDEEKAEADPLVMDGRIREAEHLRDDPSAVLGPKSVGQLKDLVAARFAAAPAIAAQAIAAIDPTFRPKEWGKD